MASKEGARRLNEECERMERADYVAEHLMGWERAEGAGYHDFMPWWKNSPGRLRCDAWNPYESADDDLMVLRAVRDRYANGASEDWNEELYDKYRYELYSIQFRQKNIRNATIDNIDSYALGDYTDAAFNVLKGEGTDG